MMIIAISAVIATISYRFLLQKNALTMAINQIKLAIVTARQQAILRKNLIIFCPNDDKTHCGTDWDRGQIILSQNQLIKIYPALSQSIHIRWISSFNLNNQIAFNRDGTTKGQQGRFEFTDSKQRILANLIVNHHGRVREEALAR